MRGQLEAMYNKQTLSRLFSFILLLMLHLSLLLIQATSAKVSYVCFTRGEGTIKLRCPGSLRIQLEEATYGRSRWGTCLSLASRNGLLEDEEGGETPAEEGTGTEATVAENLAGCTQLVARGTDCCGRTACTVPVEPVYIPTCGYHSDYLRLVYECVEDNNVTCMPKTIGQTLEIQDDAYHVTAETFSSDGDEETKTRPVETQLKSLQSQDKILVFKDYRKFRAALENKQKASQKIMGVESGVVWSLLGAGLVVVVVLSFVLVHLCRKPVKRPKHSIPSNISDHDSDSRKDEMMESMFFDDESLSPSSATSSRAYDKLDTSPTDTVTAVMEGDVVARDNAENNDGHLNDAFELEADVTRKERLVSRPRVRPPPPPRASSSGGRARSPQLSVRSVSSGISLEDPDDHDDSGVSSYADRPGGASPKSPLLQEVSTESSSPDGDSDNSELARANQRLADSPIYKCTVVVSDC